MNPRFRTAAHPTRAPARHPRRCLALLGAALVAVAAARADPAVPPAGAARLWVYADVPAWDLADEGLPFRLTLALPSGRDPLARLLLAAEARWTLSLGYARIYDSYDATTGIFKNPGGDALLASAGREYRWNLPRFAGRFTPQLAIDTGVNVATRPFPADGTRGTIKVITGLEWNRRTGAAGEVWTAGIAWSHFSNANLFSRNAGYDGLVFRVGRSWPR